MRPRLPIVAAVLIAGAASCARGNTPIVIDLLAEVPRAERRAARPVDEAIRTMPIGSGADLRPAIVAAAPARVTFTMKLPPHPKLVTAVALVPDESGGIGAGVRARIGISDRMYEQVFALDLTPPAAGSLVWHPVDVDLSAYHGWQWSLFYRPSNIAWRLIFNADPTPGGTLAWANPAIVGY
jgi:hypothetical protein